MGYHNKIMIVDDSFSTLTLLKGLLRDENYIIISANDGETALDLIKEEKPDLILLDIVMPGIDGFEVCRRIKKIDELKDIPIIFLTAATKLSERIEGLKLGAVDYLTKPFEKEELLIKVETHTKLYTYNKIFRERTAEQLIDQEQKIIQQNNEYKQLNEKLRESEKKLQASSQYARSLIEASLDSFVTINAEGKITDSNIATESVTGYSRNELLGSDFSLYFTEKENAKEIYKKVYTQGSIFNYPLTIRHASGQLIDVLYNASIYRDENGKSLGVFATARDITERKRNLEALKRSEEKLRLSYLYARSLLEASLDPLVTINANGTITDVNSATENATGISRTDLIGTDFSDYFTEPDKARAGYEEVFKQGKVIDYPLTMRQSTGKLIDVLYNASLYRDEHGNILGVFAAARDITKRKQDELIILQQNKELIKLNADKDRFISILAHDIKSPFNSILGFLTLLSQNIREYDIDEIEEQINIVFKSSKETFKLLEDILVWARAQSGKMNFAPQKINFREVFDEVNNGLSILADKKKIKINFNQSQEIFLNADKHMLLTVLRNLISNAIKFTNSDGQVDIEALIKDSKATITIRDNGIGMSPDTLSKLFDISQKISMEGTAHEKGSGFGLLLCKDFVEKHGGKIWAESETDKGSCFSFTIPIYID